jgi:hypothetical protein
MEPSSSNVIVYKMQRQFKKMAASELLSTVHPAVMDADGDRLAQERIGASSWSTESMSLFLEGSDDLKYKRSLYSALMKEPLFDPSAQFAGTSLKSTIELVSLIHIW